MSQSEFGRTSAQQLKYADSIISEIIKKAKIGHIFGKIPPRRQKNSETYTTRGGSEVGDIILNSTAHPPRNPPVHFLDPPRCPSSRGNLSKQKWAGPESDFYQIDARGFISSFCFILQIIGHERERVSY